MTAERPREETAVATPIAATITEVVLENFMAYEYARIPLRPGLNIIAGPNGAGKSSILLAISVALGQAYTERARKLSDLIRRGADTGRVSLVFDNRLHDGRRPIPFSRNDTFQLSRYLKRDGAYWYEADFREISKQEVTRLFRRFGVNPDNLLLVMHQGMIEEFTVVPPQEKLKLVEEAVGFQSYRERLLDARARLTALVTEETAVQQLLENAGQNLEYWKDVYDRYTRKRMLRQRRVELERELLWAQAARLEHSRGTILERLQGKQRTLAHTQERLHRTQQEAATAEQELAAKQTELRKLYFSLLRVEKDRSTVETTEAEAARLRTLLVALHARLEQLASPFTDQSRSSFQAELTDLQRTAQGEQQRIEDAGRRRKELAREVEGLEGEIARTEQGVQRWTTRLIDARVTVAVLDYQQKRLESEVTALQHELAEVEGELSKLAPALAAAGPRVVTERTPTAVEEELRVNAAQLESLKDVPEEAEQLYTQYAATYEELKGKLAIVAENKRQTLAEIADRHRVWRDAVQRLLDEITPVYREILGSVSATGALRLVGGEDIELAGLELLVGFRGAAMTVLDGYTQSGGERSVSVSAFLLALQHRMLSPLRAIDEFDVHLDPQNRETLMRMIFGHIRKDPHTQTLVITPSQLTVLDEDVQLIFVQTMAGKAEPKVVRAAG